MTRWGQLQNASDSSTARMTYHNCGREKPIPSLHYHEQQGAGGADDGEEPAEEETGAVFLKPILMHAEYQHAGNKEQSQKEGKHRGGEQG